jgi:4a-hydroxytetrahydrobiopterin dehydratase
MVRNSLSTRIHLAQRAAFLHTAAKAGKGDVPMHPCGAHTLCLNARPWVLALLSGKSIAMADLLKAQDIKEWLKKLPEWELDKKHIERTFEFDDFTQAIEFVNGVAEIADEEDHHPDIDVRYNKVRVALSTHSEGGLTELDFEVAEKISTLVDE